MANEVSVKLSRSATIGGQTIGGVDELVAADFQQVYRQTIATGTTDYEVDMTITLDNIYVSAIHSTQNVTIYCNLLSTNTTAHQTINVTKNVAQLYTINEPSTARTFTVNTSRLYITNGSGFDAVVQVGIAGKQAPTGGA